MNKKPVVVQLIDSIYRGGAQRVVLDIVRTLPEYHHVVCYWADVDDLEQEFRLAGAELIKLPFNGVATFPRTRSKLRSIINKYKPHVVHSHMFIPNMLMRSLKKNFVAVSTYHGECFEQGAFKSFVFRLLERNTLTRTDRIVAVSEYVKGYLKARLKIRRSIDVVYNFGRHRVDSISPVESLPLRLISTSNNQPYKDYRTLLHALAKFNDKQITLDIYGGNMESLQSLVSDLRLNTVTFKGSVQDVTAYMDGYSAFIIVSKSGEGFSLALIEAMGSGLPVVCSDIPQFLEAVGDTAVVFHRSDVESLAGRLQGLLDNPAQLRTLGSRALERAKLFSKERFRKSILEIYNNPNE